MILDGPRNRLPELTGCPQRPIRIAQELAGDEDRIRLPGRNDLLGLDGRRDHPDRTGHDFSVPADLPGKRRLKTRTERNLCMRRAAARRAIDEVYSCLPQPTRELNGLLNIPATINPIGGGNTHEQRCSLRP